MKKIFYLLLLPALMLLVNCTNESEEYTSLDEQVQKRICLVTEMAKDYGLDNFKIDEKRVRANMHMSIEDIEKEMQALSMLKGTYYIESEGNGNYRIGRKVVSPRKRLSRVEPLPNEIVKANITRNEYQGDSVTINYSFHIEFGTLYGNVQITNANFTAVVKTKNNTTGNYDEQTFTGTPNITPGQPMGYYPRYSIGIEVEIQTSSGGFSYNFTTVIDLENGEGGANQNSINYGVIQ